VPKLNAKSKYARNPRPTDRITHASLGEKVLHNPRPFDYPYALASDLLVFTMVLTYSSIATMALIFGLIYFLLANLSTRYNLVYAFKQPFEGWGKKWNTVFVR